MAGKKRIGVLAVLLAAIAVLYAAAGNTNAASVYTFATNKKQLPVYRVDRDDNKIAISFDCAWGTEHTEAILDAMEFYGVRCTFFAVSFWAEKYPETVKEILSRGHEIGTHSATHSHMNKLTATQIEEELETSAALIEKIGGKKVTLFRPPFGEYNDRLVETARGMGLQVVQWDVDSLDWKNFSAEKIASRVIGKTRSGSIILCHNNGLHTAESLPLIFSALKEKGFEFVPVGELIYRENYEIRRDGTQIKSGE